MPEQTDEATAAQRAVWALGDYPAIARDVLAPLGPELVRACGVQPGQRVLDVAAGTGNVAIPAAEAGAAVTALDLTPALVEEGRRETTRRGLDVAWVEGDAQSLPFPDAAFDVVLSSLGVMFAPDHAAAAGELLRTTRPGGRIGIVAWLPGGTAGDLLRVVASHAPAPPRRGPSPLLWGDEEHLDRLFGDGVTSLRTRPGVVHAGDFADADDAFAYFRDRFGPGLAARRRMGGDAEREAALDADMRDWAGRATVPAAGGRAALALEYVLTVADRR